MHALTGRRFLIAGGVFSLAVWGLYAFSGAGLVQRLPLLRTGLITIASVYSLRGLYHAIGSWGLFRKEGAV